MDTNGPSARLSLLSRRDSMRLFGFAGLSAMFGSTATLRAQDAAPAATISDLQGAGFYRMALGQATAILLSDGGFPMDPAALFGDVPPGDMGAAKRAAFLSKPVVPGHVNALLVREGSNNILIDTGCGNLFGPTTGYLNRNLAHAGVRSDDITHVVITHAHPDHIGGLVGTDGKLAFPKAQVIVNRAEHEFWTQTSPSFAKSKLPAEMLTVMIDGAKKSLDIAKPKLELAKPGDRVGSTITIVDAPGHTPGHVALAIESGGESISYVTDAVHVPSLQLANPDWHVLFDTDPAEAVVTRRRLLETAVADRKLIAGAHIPFPSFGHLVSQEAGYRFVPAVWEW